MNEEDAYSLIHKDLMHKGLKVSYRSNRKRSSARLFNKQFFPINDPEDLQLSYLTFIGDIFVISNFMVIFS